MTGSDVHRTRAAAPSRDGDAPESMVRSEEHLRVTTEIVPVGRVRMRKHLVTEEQTFTVPVTREEIVVDYEEIPPSEHVPDGEPLSDTSYEMVRYEERVVVTKQVVAVERVRMIRRVTMVDRTVTGQVHKELVDVEQVDLRDDAAAPGRP